MAPEKLEASYKKSQLVDQIWVYGNSYESVLVALVVPSHKLLAWAKENNVAGDMAAVCADPKAIAHTHQVSRGCMWNRQPQVTILTSCVTGLGAVFSLQIISSDAGLSVILAALFNTRCIQLIVTSYLSMNCMTCNNPRAFVHMSGRCPEIV